MINGLPIDFHFLSVSIANGHVLVKQTWRINAHFIIILELTIAFNLVDWPEWLPPHLGPDYRSVILLPCFNTLFTWMVSLLKEWNSWVFLSSRSMVSAMLDAFLNARSPVFNSLFCIFRLFSPHTNHSHNAWFNCYHHNYCELPISSKAK